MRILVFGPNGKTGLHFVELALEQGHQITAFVRDLDKIKLQHQNLKVIVGSPFDSSQLQEAMENQELVVSCLGGKANEKATLLYDMIKNIVDAMKQCGVSRIIHISSAGIHNEIPGKVTNFIISLFLKHAINDHKLAAEYIMSNGITYTIARPLSLIDSEESKSFRMSVTGIPKGGRNISRKDLAKFLLSAVESDEYVNQSIGLAY